MITFYGDRVHKVDPSVSYNRYLEQHIVNNIDDVQHFTPYPQFDSSLFAEFDSAELKEFSDYCPGNNVVVVSLHGGWTDTILAVLDHWFNSDLNRTKAFEDPDCQIVIDYSMEGFSTEVFADLHKWTHHHNLGARILYVSSDLNTADNYRQWCRANNTVPLFRSCWYGYFALWATNDLQPLSQQSHVKRYMCLNRRPHDHRVLLLALLERYNILDSGSVSMPRVFNEIDVKWSADWCVDSIWEQLKENQLGYIDWLDKDFKKMHSKLPLIADRSDFETNHALDFNTDIYAQHPINVVSETLAFTYSAFVSEKIWKPMAAGQIFLVLAGPQYLAGLQQIGFRTFSPIINEEYDMEYNTLERAILVVRELKRLISMNDSEFQQVLDRCRPIIEHNRSLITNPEKIKRLINTNLTDNIKEFANGRL